METTVTGKLVAAHHRTWNGFKDDNGREVLAGEAIDLYVVRAGDEPPVKIKAGGGFKEILGRIAQYTDVKCDVIARAAQRGQFAFDLVQVTPSAATKAA